MIKKIIRKLNWKNIPETPKDKILYFNSLY